MAQCDRPDVTDELPNGSQNRLDPDGHGVTTANDTPALLNPESSESLEALPVGTSFNRAPSVRSFPQPGVPRHEPVNRRHQLTLAAQTRRPSRTTGFVLS